MTLVYQYLKINEVIYIALSIAHGKDILSGLQLFHLCRTALHSLFPCAKREKKQF